MKTRYQFIVKLETCNLPHASKIRHRSFKLVERKMARLQKKGIQGCVAVLNYDSQKRIEVLKHIMEF